MGGGGGGGGGKGYVGSPLKLLRGGLAPPGTLPLPTPMKIGFQATGTRPFYIYKWYSAAKLM